MCSLVVENSTEVCPLPVQNSSIDVLWDVNSIYGVIVELTLVRYSIKYWLT